MKKFFLSMMAVVMMAAPLVLTSCGDEEESTTTDKKVVLTTPKYADKATKIASMSENPRGWKSIEFTESGEVIIVKGAAMAKAQAGTRAEGDVVITGTYVVLANGAFQVNTSDYTGDIVVNGSSVTVGGETYTGTQAPSVNVDSQLCRTWKIEKTIKVDGVRVDITQRKEFEKTGYPTHFIITKNGSFIVKFSKGGAESGTYNWSSGGNLLVDQLVEYAFTNLAIVVSKQVTVGFTIDGTKYEGYLVEQ